MFLSYADIEGKRLPSRLSGIAWIDPVRLGIVIYPVPFNHFARWGRNLWFYLRYVFKQSTLEAMTDHAFVVGEATGLAVGKALREEERTKIYIEAYQRGMQDGLQVFMKAFRSQDDRDSA